jgi:isopentenyl diphosphate isomerase/L-lactate dehydrogenase-like FMN-dependent dehydrogenase
MSRDEGMSESTRRRFLGGAAAAAAGAVLSPPALAAARSRPEAAPRAPTPPVGPTSPYVTYQSEIYISGMSAGIEPIFTTNLSDLEDEAAKVLSAAGRRHLIAEAGGSAAARANAKALREWRIVPRMFLDRAERKLDANVLGDAMPAPVILGPVGRQALAHREAELASARAAAALDLTYVHSSEASQSVESVAAAAPQGSRWFGLDWPGGQSAELTLTRAQAAGCTHLLLSPPQRGQGWKALAAIRKAWDGPIILGGVQSVQAARMAVRRGFDGVVVSNERGRRGPNPNGTIHRLPKIVDAVGGKAAVLFGSGVRTGTDVFRALALGADAVLIGRPYVYGLALGDGEDGVRHMLRTLLAELDIAFAIAGLANQRKLGPGALERI